MFFDNCECGRLSWVQSVCCSVTKLNWVRKRTYDCRQIPLTPALSALDCTLVMDGKWAWDGRPSIQYNAVFSGPALEIFLTALAFVICGKQSSRPTLNCACCGALGMVLSTEGLLTNLVLSFMFMLPCSAEWQIKYIHISLCGIIQSNTYKTVSVQRVLVKQ